MQSSRGYPRTGLSYDRTLKSLTFTFLSLTVLEKRKEKRREEMKKKEKRIRKEKRADF